MSKRRETKREDIPCVADWHKVEYPEEGEMGDC